MSGTNPQVDTWRNNQLTQQLHHHMRRYGYQLIDLPVIEPADLFLIKAGDQVVNRLFTFEQHGQQFALRPEFTASAAYHYISENTHQPVVRWQFSGYIFEDDPNKIQSNHQRLSIGAELIGMSEHVADAEIMSMAAQGLSQQGIKNWRITLGHIGLLRQMLIHFQVDSRIQRFLLNHISSLKMPGMGKSFILEQLDKMFLVNTMTNEVNTIIDETSTLAETETQQMLNEILDTAYRGNTMGGRTRHDIARRILQKRKRLVERDQIIAALDFLMALSQIAGSPSEVFPQISRLIPSNDTVSQELLSDWRNLIDLLMLYGIMEEQIQLQPILSRSWDYYSGIIFELRDSNNTHLGGGGRYDDLTRLLGGQDTVPAVGFAYYADELLKAIPHSSASQHNPHTIVFDNNSIEAATRWAEALRQQDLNIQLLPYHGFQDTPSSACLYAREDGTVTFKDQQFTFEQINDLSENLKGM